MSESAKTLLQDAYHRIREHVRSVTEGLRDEVLLWRPTPASNSIGWLLWHAARVQDDHVAQIAGVEQVWTREGFYGRFELPYPPAAHGYGQTSEEVGQFRGAAALLDEYQNRVHVMVLEYLDTITDAELSRIVDTSWDPPVTASVRLVSVFDDCAQHLGQAAYLRGIVGDWSSPEG
ncbi:MAG: mycothiol transferase [Segniliparus sp.]|uniref:mycothiol transferase n=1 Tax=Segniliparus sp. TaxID=2804064 RepID=UPI003F3829D1